MGEGAYAFAPASTPFPGQDVLALNIIDNPEDRLPFLAVIFGLTRPMLVAMTNNSMMPETWQAAIDLLLVTLDAMTREGGGGNCRFVEVPDARLSTD